MGSHIRERIEKAFGRFARLSFRHPVLTLLIVVALVGGLMSQLRHLTVDTSTEGFLRESDPALIAYNDFRDRFGRDEVVLIAVHAPGGDIFEPSFLARIKDVHGRLAATVPYLDEINSLINARNTYADGDTLMVDDLLANLPDDPAALAAVRERALANPLYRDLLISADATWTAVVVRTLAFAPEKGGGERLEEFGDDFDGGFDEPAATPVASTERRYLTDAQNSAVVAAVMVEVDRLKADGFTVALSGSPTVTDHLKRAMMRDMPRFTLTAVGVIAVFLFLMFRRLSAVLMPLAVVLMALWSTIGLMAALDIPLKMPTMIIPSFVLAVGVGDAVHILALFYRRLHDRQTKEEAIVYAVGHSGLAVLLTSLTTAAGLLSFGWADIAPVGELGIFASFGVTAAFVYTIAALPAMIALSPIADKAVIETGSQHHRMDRLLEGIADFATGNPRVIAAVAAAITVVALIGAARIEFSHNPLVWFPKSAQVRLDTELINKVMNGSVSAEVIVDTGVREGAKDPAFLKKIAALQEELSGYAYEELFVGKTMTLADIIKEINKALNRGEEAFYTVPDDPDLAAQEFILFENSGTDDLTDFVDPQFTMTRFTMKTPWVDAITYRPFIDHLHERFSAVLGADVKVTVTGMVPLLGRTLYATIHSAAESYAIALVVISVMMVWLIGQVRLGLVSMIPNLFPIVFTLGVIGWFEIPMDMFTMLFASIAIGLAVDDTIHFMHNFRRYFEETGDVAEAVRRTLHTTGRAMLTTTIVLSAGFYIMCFATLSNLFYFGLLTGSTILVALAADFLLAPALMVFVAKPKS
jgi:predicted RND superfamily exporter protein